MSIHILTGRPGTGKTLYLTKKAKDFLDEGKTVWANKGYKIKDDRVKYYGSITELVHLRDGIILMDEAQVYLNSRKWESLDESFIYKLQQHRHHGLHIYGTVQNVKRLDVVMRELVSNYYECHFINLGFLKYVLVREFDIKDAEKPDDRRKSFGFSLSLVRKEVFDLYDTFGDVELMTEMVKDVVQRDFKKCVQCGHEKLIR